mgnify:CR=1 FL=1
MKILTQKSESRFDKNEKFEATLEEEIKSEKEALEILELSKKHKEEFKVVLEGRIPDKTTLLTSLRLTPSSCPSRQVLLTYPCLSDIDIIETSNLICLADEPDFETIDPDKANRWLIDAGAKDIADFFTESLTQPLEDECNLTTPRISLFSRSSSCNENKRQRASTTGNLDYQFKRN